MVKIVDYQIERSGGVEDVKEGDCMSFDERSYIQIQNWSKQDKPQDQVARLGKYKSCVWLARTRIRANHGPWACPTKEQNSNIYPTQNPPYIFPLWE